jgi:hypothetical protein
MGSPRTIYAGGTLGASRFDEVTSVDRLPQPATGLRLGPRAVTIAKNGYERDKAQNENSISRPFRRNRCSRILSRVETPLETQILKNEGDAERLAPLLAEAEIVVGHIWRAGFPPSPRLRLLQSVAAGLDLLDTGALPKGSRSATFSGTSPQSPNTSL